MRSGSVSNGSGRRKGLAGIVAVLAGALALLVPASAFAAEIDAISDVTIVEPADQVNVGDRLELEASWAVPDTANPGDTFSLGFPTTPLVVGIADTFTLEGPASEDVGTCVVGAGGIVCTLGEYVATHNNVQGTLTFFAQAQEVTEKGTVTFTTGGGVPIEVDVPGGGIGPSFPTPVPTDAIKSGVVTTAGDTIEWYIWVPSNLLTGDPQTLTDKFTPGLTLLPETMSIGHVAVADWNGGTFDPSDFTTLVAGTGYTLSSDAANSSFTIDLTAPTTPDSLYRVLYQTRMPANVQTGDLFENTISGTGFTTTTSTVTHTGGGGTGGGDGPGGFSVVKTLTGDGASTVPTDRPYVFDYTYTLDGVQQSGQLSVTADGTPAGVENIPGGTVVTLREVTPAPVDGVIWAAPVYAGQGVKTVDGAAQFTIVEESTVAATVINPADLEPGPSTGSFAITKQVTGPGASEIPQDQVFSVEYRYDLKGEPVTGRLDVPVGQTRRVQDVPAGVTVTLRELAPTLVEGVTWGTPRFTGNGIEVNDTGEVRLTIGAGTEVQIALENPTTQTPPTPPTSPPGTFENAPPTSPQTSLATTGAGLLVPAFATIALLTTGTLLWFFGRRRQEAGRDAT